MQRLITFLGFLVIPMAGALAQVPVITSPTEADATVSQEFTYTITADNNPTGFSTPNGLPAWLTLNNDIISGTPAPEDAGTEVFEIQASNGDGDSEPQTVTLTVAFPPAPVVNSPATAAGTVGAEFRYTITTEQDNALTYAAPVTPDWITNVDRDTGVVSGIPDLPGTYTMEVTARNSGGVSDPLEVEITIEVAPPIITSPDVATGRVGAPFLYTIETDAPALGYSATDLPPGISRSGNRLGGTPTEPGIYRTQITAFNSGGSSTALELVTTVNNADGSAPDLVITSPLALTEVAGSTFSYQITATADPERYRAFGIGPNSLLPDLGINEETGLITGTLPSEPGVYDVGLRADYPGTADAAEATLQISVPDIPELSVSFVEPTSDLIIAANGELGVEFRVNAATGIGSITRVDLFSNDQIIATATTSPFVFDVVFSEQGVFQMVARVTNSLETTAETETITVTVEPPNAVVRNEDFVVQTFQDLFFRAPSATELSNGVDFLDQGGTRGEYIANLMTTQFDQLSITATLQIYRVAGGFWPDYATLQQELTDYFEAGSDAAYANTLAQVFRAKFPDIVIPITEPQNPLEPENIDYDVWQNELDFLNALYINKYGKSADRLGLVFSLNVLALAFFNSVEGGSVEGGGDMVSNFATTNRLSGAIGPAGAPLSVAIENTQEPGPGAVPQEVYGFEVPNFRFNDRVRASQLISGLLRQQPTDAQVDALSRQVESSFSGAIQDILESPEYESRFEVAYTLEVNTEGDGEGDVVVDPSQPDPLNPTDYIYNEGTVVNLMATPEEGSVFIGWTGDVISPLESIIVTMSSDLSVTASFAPTLMELLAETMADAGVTDPADTAPGVDFDGDGVLNITEIAFGSQPADMGSEPEFETFVAGDDFIVEYIRLREAQLPEGAEIVVECSESLDAGDWTAVNDNQISVDGVSQEGVPENYERVRVTVPLGVDCTFVRGRVIFED